MGPSAQGREGVTEVIMNGALVKRNPKTMNGMDRMNLVLRCSIAAAGRGLGCRTMRGELASGLTELLKLLVGCSGC